jgi:hypothetical protein
MASLHGQFLLTGVGGVMLMSGANQHVAVDLTLKLESGINCRGPTTVES